MKPSFSFSRWLTLGFVVAAFIAAAAFYGALPEQLPIHWNIRGEVDGYASKPWGPFILPLSMAATYVLLAMLPRLSPRGFGIEKFADVFDGIVLATMAFLFAVSMMVLLVGLGVRLNATTVVFAGVGVLFVAIGNVVGKVRKNYFVGFRTPWALANDEVWLRTNRLGGRLMVLSGLAMLAASLADYGLVAAVAASLVITIVPVVYSYRLYRRLDAAGAAPG